MIRTHKATQAGNALIYVLIAIALFGALSFTLSRQTDNSEASTLDQERLELLATQIITYTAQVKSIVDQMIFSGTDINELEFMLPTHDDFNDAPHIHKLFHPQGGGLNLARLPKNVISQTNNNPPAGWYIGRFTNVDWSTLGPGNDADLPYQDVMLVAYQISKNLCANLNSKITGSTAIPIINEPLKEIFIDADFYNGDNVDDFTTEGSGAICEDCEGYSSLCVQNQTGNIFAFYTVIADQ